MRSFIDFSLLEGVIWSNFSWFLKLKRIFVLKIDYFIKIVIWYVNKGCIHKCCPPKIKIFGTPLQSLSLNLLKTILVDVLILRVRGPKIFEYIILKFRKVRNKTEGACLKITFLRNGPFRGVARRVWTPHLSTAPNF